MNSQLPQRADIIVIGAGVMGSSIAYHLAKTGGEGKKVVLLEKKVPAGGPSGKSHAVMPQYYTLEPLARMTSESWRFYLNFDKIVGKDPVFHKVGILWAYQESLAEKWKMNVAHVQKYNLAPKIISDREIKEISPQFYLPEFYAAAYDRDGGYVDSHRAVDGFVSAASEMGVNVLPYTRVEGLEAQNGRIRSVRTDKGTIEAEKIISAAGIWTRPLLQKIGFDVPITNTKVGICMMKRPSGFRGDHEVLVDYVNSCYLRAQGDAVTDIAVFEPHVDTYFDSSKSEDPDNYEDSVPEANLGRYVEIGARYPGLRDATIQGTYACVYDNSPDRQPVLGEVPGVQGLFVATGFSGHGFKMAPMIGRSMSELVLSGKSQIDLGLLTPSRFKEGRLIRYDPLFDDA
jgi:glycine/D-amino acid oxidase-like deaminating enzyme